MAKQNAESSESGFVLVDALIGVVIASMMLGMCLLTLNLARKQMKATQQNREASIVLQTLLETTPRQAGHYRGTQMGFSYGVEVSEVSVKATIICHLKAKVTQQTRNYDLEGDRWCDQNLNP